VLANNLDLRVALVDPTLAGERVSQEEARFESAFTLRSRWRETDSPTSSQLDANQSRGISLEPGVRIPMRTGGDVTVSLPMARSESDNSFSTLNPAYTSDLQFSISHPLLRNAGRRATTTALRIASYNRQATEARTKLEAIRQLAAVDRSYWRLYQTRAELDVAQQQYELANEQLARAQRRVGAGLINEIEVVRAQAGLADRLGAIISAQRNVLIQQRELKRVVNLPGLTLDTATIIVPATPPDPVEYELEPKAAADFAVMNRMEMLELELRLATDAAQIDLARNQALPLLTMDYTYRVNGLGGSAQDSFRTLNRNQFEDWEVGLSAEIPLGNAGAKSRVREAILARVQRLSTRAARDQAIRQETLNAIDDLGAGYQSIIAARQSVILNTRALQSEQRAFDTGRSTSTDVLDAAARLAEAQVAEIRALANYQISQVDLAFATGTVLGAAKVGWEPVDPPGPDTTAWYKQSMPDELDDGVEVDAPDASVQPTTP
jgi:outer membrane protein TolC